MTQKKVTIEAAKDILEMHPNPAGGLVGESSKTLNNPGTGRTARRAQTSQKPPRKEKLMSARSVASRHVEPDELQPAPALNRTSPIEPRALSAFQRVLLATDGTLTDILEAYLAESMRVVKLHQETEETRAEISELDLPPGSTVVRRRILLRGKWSHKNYLYAESILVPERLNEHLRTGVFSTRKPLGQLIVEAALETRREILGCHLEPAADLGRYFDVAKGEQLISRTYRIFAEGKAIMLITEKFPRTYFTEEA
jgi:chorismate-pyruvate lyase